MADKDEAPKTDSLGPGDVRWLQSEFAAVRAVIDAAVAGVHQRIDDHIAVGHPDIVPARRSGDKRRKRIARFVAITSILTSIAGVAGAFLGNFLNSGAHVPGTH